MIQEERVNNILRAPVTTYVLTIFLFSETFPNNQFYSPELYQADRYIQFTYIKRDYEHRMIHDISSDDHESGGQNKVWNSYFHMSA